MSEDPYSQAGGTRGIRTNERRLSRQVAAAIAIASAVVASGVTYAVVVEFAPPRAVGGPIFTTEWLGSRPGCMTPQLLGYNCTSLAVNVTVPGGSSISAAIYMTVDQAMPEGAMYCPSHLGGVQLYTRNWCSFGLLGPPGTNLEFPAGFGYCESCVPAADHMLAGFNVLVPGGSYEAYVLVAIWNGSAPAFNATMSVVVWGFGPEKSFGTYS